MFIDGHIILLNNTLKFFNNYFKDIKYKNVNYKKLKKGSIYPDLPCGKYKISNNNILFTNYTLCKSSNILKLLYDVDYGEENIYQFHRGYFAHLHSMTTDPENNVLKIRNKIITSIIGYGLLAVYDNTLFDEKPKISPNIFWIGLILHIITDSYSESHTIRNLKAKYIKTKSKETNENKIMRLKIHNLIKNIAKESDIYSKKNFISKLLLELENNLDIITFIKKQKNILYKSYIIFKFEYNTINKVSKYCHNLDKKLSSGSNDKVKYGDIVAFQYSLNQPLLFHQKLDLIDNILKNKIMYNKMIYECVYLLKIYKIFLEDNNVKKFIKNILELTLNRTFKINIKYLKDKTDKIYIDSKLYKYL